MYWWCWREHWCPGDGNNSFVVGVNWNVKDFQPLPSSFMSCDEHGLLDGGVARDAGVLRRPGLHLAVDAPADDVHVVEYRPVQVGTPLGNWAEPSPATGFGKA